MNIKVVKTDTEHSGSAIIVEWENPDKNSPSFGIQHSMPNFQRDEIFHTLEKYKKENKQVTLAEFKDIVRKVFGFPETGSILDA